MHSNLKKNWSRGRVARQRSAKPRTAVRVRPRPQVDPDYQLVRVFFISDGTVCGTKITFLVNWLFIYEHLVILNFGGSLHLLVLIDDFY